jgi:hypothetical protein
MAFARSERAVVRRRTRLHAIENLQHRRGVSGYGQNDSFQLFPSLTLATIWQHHWQRQSDASSM